MRLYYRCCACVTSAVLNKAHQQHAREFERDPLTETPEEGKQRQKGHLGRINRLEMLEALKVLKLGWELLNS